MFKISKYISFSLNECLYLSYQYFFIVILIQCDEKYTGRSHFITSKKYGPVLEMI